MDLDADPLLLTVQSSKLRGPPPALKHLLHLLFTLPHHWGQLYTALNMDRLHANSSIDATSEENF